MFVGFAQIYYIRLYLIVGLPHHERYTNILTCHQYFYQGNTALYLLEGRLKTIVYGMKAELACVNWLLFVVFETLLPFRVQS